MNKSYVLAALMAAAALDPAPAWWSLHECAAQGRPLWSPPCLSPPTTHTHTAPPCPAAEPAGAGGKLAGGAGLPRQPRPAGLLRKHAGARGSAEGGGGRGGCQVRQPAGVSRCIGVRLM